MKEDCTSFSYGQHVHIINQKNPYYGQQGEFIAHLHKYGNYRIRLKNSRYITVGPGDIASLFDPDTLYEITYQQYIQMQELAVELNDRDWFEEIGHKIKRHLKKAKN
ncbi:hypothetical protein PP175_09110 [Aneurinibacillus sp. Ricciae_BoGa-3]|uniref:hypothetical protein n=1 Tax=Aneurinibacillus sp. Ricciae_BoGa-3 TaxID=3022697 RepID=UPI00233F9743|nr:hypothetical protein [Aneurinibacillus sp. Ricciae_BoGa-3]WCK56046.1 hypothetical protein PP175_09110 [Aneurinibacillus sp. Ricciae_BoGa-3]